MFFDLDDEAKMPLSVFDYFCQDKSAFANAAVCAEKIKADLFIKLTNVEGIFTKDPKKYKSARLIEKLSFGELGKIAEKKTAPAQYGILDPLALAVINRKKIKTVVMSGRNPKHLFDVLQGGPHGTVIG